MQNTGAAEEIELFRNNVKRFIAAEILPFYGQWEKDQIVPRELWTKLGEQGLLAVDLPEEYGGFGCSFHFAIVVIEEFARANCASLTGPLSVHSDIVAHYIFNHGISIMVRNCKNKHACLKW